MNIAIKNKHPLERWTIVHNFFLEKIPGKPLLEKLRVIHIFEADYNIILKYFIAKKTLRNALKHNTTAYEQAGGRPGRTAIDEAVRTVTTFETCNLQRVSGGVMYNDAKACFDRIVENISNITCLNAGAPMEIVELHHNTLQAMKYIVKHKKGLSSLTNGHMKPDPFHGVGQGAGDGGTRWGFISDMIIRAYNKKSHNAILTSAITKIFSNHKVQAFVDDSRLFIIIPDNNGQTIMQHLKDDVQLWELLLQVTGAKLELTKCKFFVFTWAFDKNGEAYISHVDDNTHITIQDSDTKEDIIVEAMKTDEAYKLLGVQIQFEGKHTLQVANIETKANHLIDVFQRATLQPDELTLGYNTIAIPTIYYTFPASSFPAHELRSIQQRITKNLLPKLGLNHTFPRAITYAPQYFGGIGFKDMEVEYSVAHLTNIVGHFRAKTPLADSIQQLMEAYMVLAGLEFSPLITTDTISYVNAPWLEVSREFLRKINGKIVLNSMPTIPSLRQHDINIMTAARAQCTSKELRQINQCRSYLQITYISEMCNTFGTKIVDFYRHPENHPSIHRHTYSTSLLIWPLQAYPPTASWQTWRKFLGTFTKPNMVTELKTRLGTWHTNFDTQRNWHYQYNSNAIHQISQDNQCHNRWTTTTETRLCQTYESVEPINDQTYKPYVPIFPSIGEDILTIPKTVRQPYDPIHMHLTCQPTLRPSTFDSKFHELCTNPFDHITKAQTIMIYTSGITSFKGSAAGWIIATETTKLYQGKIRLANTSDNTILRSSSLAILAALKHYHQIYHKFHYPIPPQKIIVYTNNITTTKRIARTKNYNTTASKQFAQQHECIAAITHQLHQNSNLSIQYNDPKPEDCSINIILGHSRQHAYNALTICQTEESLQDLTNIATVIINDQEIPSNIPNQMRFAAQSPELRTFLKKKYKWSDKVIDTIDWEIHSKAIQNQHPMSKKTTIKFIHRWLPTHAHPATKIDLTTKCPTCNIHEETNDHFLSCDNPDNEVEWKQQLNTFADDLRKAQTDPILAYYLILAVSQWRTTRQPPTPPFCTDAYKVLFDEQTAIGWNQVIMGRLSTSWVDIQNAYQNTTTLDGTTIIAKAITKIYNIVQHMWKKRCDNKYRPQDDILLRQNILLPAVHSIYSQCQDINATDRAQFDTPIETILNQNTANLQKWIRRSKQYLKESIARTKTQLNTIPRITQFFDPLARQSINRGTASHTSLPQHRTTHEIQITTNPRPPPKPNPANAENIALTLLFQPP